MIKYAIYSISQHKMIPFIECYSFIKTLENRHVQLCILSKIVSYDIIK